MKMNKLSLFLLLASNIALADVPADQVKKIDHLLDYIRKNGCTIIKMARKISSNYQQQKAL